MRLILCEILNNIVNNEYLQVKAANLSYSESNKQMLNELKYDKSEQKAKASKSNTKKSTAEKERDKAIKASKKAKKAREDTERTTYNSSKRTK